MQWNGASDQQMPSCKLIGINLDTEPLSHFMSGKTWAFNDGLNVGAKACILPLGYGYCDLRFKNVEAIFPQYLFYEHKNMLKS